MAVALAMREQGAAGERPPRPPGRRPLGSRSTGPRSTRWSASRSSFVGTAVAQVAAFVDQVGEVVAAPSGRGRVPARAAPVAHYRRRRDAPPAPPVLRQGPGHLRRRRRPAADGHVRPALGLRRRARRADPHKGRVLTAISAFWFEELATSPAATSCRPTSPTCPPRSRRPTPTWPGGSCCAAGRRCSRSSASCGATCPGRRGRSTAPAARCTARRCPPGCRRATSCPSRCSRRPPRATVPRREHLLRAGGRPGRRGAGRRGPGPSRSSCTRGAPRWRRERGIIIADTKFELGLVDGELVAVRRGADARTRAGSGRSTSGRRARHRRASTSSRCATTSRASTGTRTRRRRRCRPRSSRPPAPLHRGLRAHHRPLVRRPGPAWADALGAPGH